jgi:hypothetical protein
MKMRDQLEAEFPEHFRAILSVARCSDSAGFLDLLWPPFDYDREWPRMRDMTDPGVMLEAPRRVVVVDTISNELRYYAGGWYTDQSRAHLEDDRFNAEGSELGVFPSLEAAVTFARRFLVDAAPIQEIDVARHLFGERRDTDVSCLAELAAQGALPG